MTEMHGNALRFGSKTAIGREKSIRSNFFFQLERAAAIFGCLFSASLVLIGRYSAENSLEVQKVVERNSSGKLVPVPGWTPNTLFVLDEGREVTGFLLFSTRNSYAIVDSATGRGRVINSQLVKYVEPIAQK